MQITQKLVRSTLTLLGVVALVGCLDVGGAPDQPTDPTQESFAASLGIDSGLKSFTKTTNGVYYKDTQKGSVGKLDSLSVVNMTFQTYLTNGSLIDFQQNANIDMHAIKVAGLIEGMLGFGATGGMVVGSTRIIVVPSELAYGNQPQGSIPANATLVFIVTLRSIG